METNTFLRGIDATTGAAAPILVSMEGYVGRFGILKAPSLTVPVLTHTLVSGVRERLTTVPRHRESTTCSIQTINGFLLTVTCSQNLALYRHWYNRSPWARRTFLWAKGLVTILLWLKVTMKWSGHCNDYISNGVNVSWINEYVNIWGSNFFNCTSLTIQRSPEVLARRCYNSRIRGCEFDGRPGEVNYQNNFREYGVMRGAECGFFYIVTV